MGTPADLGRDFYKYWVGALRNIRLNSGSPNFLEQGEEGFTLLRSMGIEQVFGFIHGPTGLRFLVHPVGYNTQEQLVSLREAFEGHRKKEDDARTEIERRNTERCRKYFGEREFKIGKLSYLPDKAREPRLYNGVLVYADVKHIPTGERGGTSGHLFDRISDCFISTIRDWAQANPLKSLEDRTVLVAPEQ